MVGASLNFVAAGRGRGGLIGRPQGFEETFVAEFHGVGDLHAVCRRTAGTVGVSANGNAGFRRPGDEKAYRPSARYRVGAQQSERVGVAAVQERVNFCAVWTRGKGS